MAALIRMYGSGQLEIGSKWEATATVSALLLHSKSCKFSYLVNHSGALRLPSLSVGCIGRRRALVWGFCGDQ